MQDVLEARYVLKLMQSAFHLSHRCCCCCCHWQAVDCTLNI